MPFEKCPKAITAEHLAILQDRQTFNRQIETPNGHILCRCNGTSIDLRTCLESLTDFEEREKINHGSQRTPHMRVVRACIQQGLARIESVISQK